jgi:hypothetical protein
MMRMAGCVTVISGADLDPPAYREESTRAMVGMRHRDQLADSDPRYGDREESNESEVMVGMRHRDQLKAGPRYREE